MAVMTSDELGKHFCEALGIKNVRKITIVLESKCIAKMITESYIDKDAFISLSQKIVEEHELKKKENK